jgi:hypothetical protein
VVISVLANIIEIIVLSASPDALLRVHHATISSKITVRINNAEKYRLKLQGKVVERKIIETAYTMRLP